MVYNLSRSIVKIGHQNESFFAEDNDPKPTTNHKAKHPKKMDYCKQFQTRMTITISRHESNREFVALIENWT